MTNVFRQNTVICDFCGRSSAAAPEAIFVASGLLVGQTDQNAAICSDCVDVCAKRIEQIKGEVET